MENKSKYAPFILIAAGVLCIVGIILRFYHILLPEFLFYDEAMYIGYNRRFLELVAHNPPHSFQEFLIISGLMFKNALTTAKAFWFYLLNLRVFVVGPQAYGAARLVSALAGLATVYVTYCWAKRYFKLNGVAWLSAMILLLLPSHVFYSRLGMQESLSTLLFLWSLYLFYFSGRGLSWSLVASAILMSLVYFTNYRMIIAPVFVIGSGLFTAWTQQVKIDGVKWGVFVFIFAALILGVGSLYGGINNYVNFGWMLNQAGEAASHRHAVNFLSFPYYVFKLDGIGVGLLFFSCLWLMARRQWGYLLPAVFVFIQMGLFSFAAEKGARYLCVVLPFLSMAVAYQAYLFYERYVRFRAITVGVLLAILIGMIMTATPLALAKTSYEEAVAFIFNKDPQAKVLSTQPLVESLYVQDDDAIKAFPKTPQEFAKLLAEGYRYVVLDPQAYISWTADEERFTPVLIPPLDLMQHQLKPLAVFDHIQGPLLERFVLDHNQDLLQSLSFLREASGKGKIYIYDLKAPE